MLYSPFVLLHSYNNHSSWSWKKNINDFAKGRSSYEKSNNARHHHTRSYRYQQGTVKRKKHSLPQVQTEKHPLKPNNNIQETKYNTTTPLPKMNYLNLDDLDLEDIYSIEEDLIVKDTYKPIYSRMVRSPKPTQIDETNCDLESWPGEKITPSPDTEKQPITTRQPASNPLFLKLYAMENNAVNNKRLPLIQIDDNSLANVNNSNIKQFDYDENIQLAIMTKKKIWIDYCNGIIRKDKFGDNVPSKQNFISTRRQDCKMRLPCGKLSRGKNHSDLQYVVKGWCDERFI